MNRSMLPVQNNAKRPTSSHSLPEYQRSSPVHLPPRSHRRPHTPRSSPLAGPAVSSEADGENKDDQGNQKPRYRPNRISSTPDVVFPIQSIYDSDTTLSSPPRSISGGTNGIVISHLPISKSSSSSSSGEDDKESKEDAEDGNILYGLAKRLSMISLWSLTTNEKDRDDQNTAKRRSSFGTYSASTTSLASTSSSRTLQTQGASQAVPPIPTIPRWALNAMREEAGIASRNMNYGNQHGTTEDLTASFSPPLPNQPIPRGVRPSASNLSNQPRPRTISCDPTDDWISVKGPTPRFSRLGLAGDGIVMPVSKESSEGMKIASSIRSTKSTSTLSQSAGARRDSGVTNRTEYNPRMDWSNDSSAANTQASPKEQERLRKRSSLGSSLKAKISRTNFFPSTESENIPPVPRTISKSAFTASRTSLRTSYDSVPRTLKTSVSPPSIAAPPSFTRSTAFGRDNVFAAVNDNQLPSFTPSDTPAESGRRTADVKLQGTQDTQKSKMKRKSVKQFVMWITAAPTSGEKLKVTTIHDSPSTVALPSDTFMPLDPPPRRRFDKPANSSVPNLSFTKEVPSQSGGKRFKNIRKKLGTVFSNARG